MSCADPGMEKILIEQYKKYPHMQEKDYYKLLFQSEFGIKHLLIDTSESRKYLFSEMNSIEQSDEPLYEFISGDHRIIRVNLSAFKKKAMSIDLLFDVMKESAEKITGSDNNFLSIWHQLKILIEKQIIPMDIKMFIKYETQFQRPLKEEHHSETYIENYNPHYRVVLKELFDNAFIIHSQDQ